MTELTHSLDSKSEEALRTVIGKLNVGFYFPDAWIRVDREGVNVSSVSIPTGKNAFIVITCEWGDTVEDFLDIWYFSVSIEDRPREIASKRYDNCPSGWAFEHVSTIHTWDWTIIEKVLIYEVRETGERESVRYDRAILFKYAKGEILVSAGATLPGRFEVNHKPDVIEKMLSPLSLRKKITDDVALQVGLTQMKNVAT